MPDILAEGDMRRGWLALCTGLGFQALLFGIGLLVRTPQIPGHPPVLSPLRFFQHAWFRVHVAGGGLHPHHVVVASAIAATVEHCRKCPLLQCACIFRFVAAYGEEGNAGGTSIRSEESLAPNAFDATSMARARNRGSNGGTRRVRNVREVHARPSQRWHRDDVTRVV